MWKYENGKSHCKGRQRQYVTGNAAYSKIVAVLLAGNQWRQGEFQPKPFFLSWACRRVKLLAI